MDDTSSVAVCQLSELYILSQQPCQLWMVLSGLESLTNHSCLAQVSCMKDRTRLYSLFPAEFSQVARWDKNLPYSSLRLDQQ